MKKRIYLVLETEADEDDKSIRSDIEQELGMATHYFETVSYSENGFPDKWISVTDGLPERHKTPCPRGNNPDFSNVSETVWICTQEGYTMEGTLEGDSWFDDMGQCLSDYFEDMAGHHVTHWMPLPEPPKEV